MEDAAPSPTFSDLGLVDGPPHEDFDRLTRLAGRLFATDVALISIVEPKNDRQFFTSALGLPEPWATSRETPLSHSFCQYVVSQNEPLVVEDAREHPLVKGNGAIRDLGAIAYLGAPIYGLDDAPIGALCVIEQEPRAWDKEDIISLVDLSSAVSSRIKQRALLWTQEEALRRASRFGRIVERAAHEVFVFDAHTLRFTEANAGARENLGYSPDELKEMTPLDIKPEYTRDQFEALIAPLQAGSEPHLEFETVHERRDGSLYRVAVRLELHQDFGVSSFVAFCRDVTEQRSIERAFEDAVGAMPGRFMMFDSDARLVFANNNEFAPIASLSDAWAQGMTFENAVMALANSGYVQEAKDDPVAWAGGLNETLRQGKNAQYTHVDGRIIEIRQSGTKADGKIILTLDVTEREQALATAEHAQREADAANQAKSEFLASMSHELRTPLNSIIGFGQLLEMDHSRSLTPDQLEYTRHIVKSGHHLLALVSEVLDLAGIEAGHLKLSIEPVDAAAAIKDVFSIMGPVAEKAGITLEIEDSDWRPSVKADVQRLRQVLLNLVSNAVKYNRPNGTVTLRLVNHEGQARIEVSDTGLGIDEALWPKLFTPFDRLGRDASAIEGAGIGLALSKRLAEAMEGAVGFRSVANEGSTFWVDLALTEEARHKEASVTGGLEANADNRYTVLYVEDNPSNLRLMEHLMATQPNVELLSAPSGNLGLEIARAQRPDVIVLDLNLPGMSGFDVLAQLKAQPETQSTPVLALTAASMPNDVRRGLEAGFFRYITKPLDVNAFLGAIELALQSRHGDSNDGAAASCLGNLRLTAG